MSSERLVDSTLLAGIYGNLDRDSWATDAGDCPDPYSLFADNALAMGWSTPGPGGLTGNLWEMNEASDLHSSEAQKPGEPLTWFQVGFPETRPANPLPLVPLVKNAWEATARFGRLEVLAVQVLAPFSLGGPADQYLYSATGWFSAVDPEDRVTVRVSLDTGDTVHPIGDVHSLATVLGKLRVAGFDFDLSDVKFTSRTRTTSEYTALRMGLTENTVTFGASLPDWTAESVGWTIAILAECCRSTATRTSGLITVATT